MTDVPSGLQDKKWKSITFQINKCEFFSSKQRDWCAMVFQKKFKKTYSTIVHLANMSSRSLEINDIDLNIKHTYVSVEPYNGRFCFVCENEDAESGIKRFDFHIYIIDKEKFILKEIGVQ